jgi:hypothetical protein
MQQSNCNSALRILKRGVQVKQSVSIATSEGCTFFGGAAQLISGSVTIVGYTVGILTMVIITDKMMATMIIIISVV